MLLLRQTIWGSGGGSIRINGAIGEEGDDGGMKKFIIRTLGVISGLGALSVFPTLWFNLCGLARLGRDCAGGPAWVNGLIVLVCVSFIAGAFYLSYRLLRLVIPSQDSK
jgi:hypothetical protein